MSVNPALAKYPPLFYGWLVVAGAFAVTFVGFGCVYSFSAFVESLEHDTPAAVVMDYFGGRNVSGIIGILYTSVGFGTLIGPTAAGFAFDATRSYTLPILASVAANVIAAVIIALSVKRVTKYATAAEQRRRA